MTTADRVATFGQQTLAEQFDSLPLDDFQQELEATFVDESYSYYPYELILPCTSDDLVLHRDFASVPRPTGRLVAGFDVGRVLPSGKVAFDAERTHHTGHADRFWAIALACQKERGPAASGGSEIGVRVLG